MFSAFSEAIAQLQQSTQKLRSERRQLYKLLTLTLNASLLLTLYAAMFRIFSVFEAFFSSSILL